MATSARIRTLLVLTAALAVLVAGPASAAAPGTWTHQSPMPAASNYTTVEVLSATQAWAAGSSGVIVHTADGGATWTTQATPAGTDTIYRISFLDAAHGWAGVNNAVLYTTDGGATWKKGTGPVGSVSGVGFATTTDGFAAAGAKVLYASTDGGATWTSRATPIAVSGVRFFDAQHGVVTGAGGVMHTADGGKTFTTVKGPHGGSFLDPDHGWFLSGSTAEYTTDGGATWHSATLPAGQWVYSEAAFGDGSNGWAAGASQGIVHSSDGGKTWVTQMASGASVNAFWGIDFADALHGAAVGNGGIVFTTADGGATWVDRQSGSDTSTNDLALVDAQHLWAANAFGEILRTTDGGGHWEKAQVGSTTSHFYGIDFASAQTGWAVGDAEQSFSHGMIYGTKDGGQTWTLQWDGGTGYNWLYDVKALSPKVAVAVGNLGIILRTTNGGATWTEVTNRPGAAVLSGVTFTGKVGYTVGNGSKIFRSVDGGLSWGEVTPNLGFSASLMDAAFVNSSTGWVVGFDGVVLRTTNGGRSWTDQGFGTSSGMNILAVEAIDPATAWISGWDSGRNYVARTTDAGATWVAETIPQTTAASSISDVEFLDADTGWAGGYQGIWKRTA